MMEARSRVTDAFRPGRRWVRLPSRGGATRSSWNRRWLNILRWAIAGAVLIGLGIMGVARYQQVPKVEPPFERIVGMGSGPIKAFGLEDLDGREHTAEEWKGRPAAVLFMIAPECSISRDYAAEMKQLARKFGSRGVVFFGIHSGAGVGLESSRWRSAGWDLPFPILRDPEQLVARQAGVRVTPEAVVVLPDGQVIYRGRIDDRYSGNGEKSAQPQVRDLAIALEAILADEMPVVTTSAGYGTPLAPTPAGDDPGRKITFTKDVAPILWQNCARCHRHGEVGPFPLLTYRDAARRADFIREVTASGQMPPWKAHPGAGVFVDASRLSTIEKEVLARWAETGCQEGDPADLPTPPRFSDGWALGQPDLVLTVPEPMVLSPDGEDLYRAFAIPFSLDHDVTISGVEFRPGNRRVVHHSRVHLDATGDAIRRDRTDPGPGFAGWVRKVSFELPYPGLGGWSPGMTPRFAPDGVGRLVPHGSDVVFMIHYHPSGKVERDQSSVGLYFARGPVTRQMTGFTLSTAQIDIPPGAKRHAIIQSARLKADVHLYTVVPHAHYLCREFRLAATLPDGTCQPLLWIDDWNMDWQDQYRYVKPVKLPKGAILTLATYFDNSEDNPRNPNKPPRRIRYGVGTMDEMCACHLEILPDDPSGYVAYPNKSPFGL
jgi:thiol-disulfide isomerase/thioredoxin